MKKLGMILGASALMLLAACQEEVSTSQTKDAEAVNRQNEQYRIGQPVPAYDWSLERELLIQLYDIRNGEVTTHSVWRSNYGTVEGDCPSMGYGLPYDTSLTNPWVGTKIPRAGHPDPVVVVGQQEPNGVFASTNTAATWVFCIGASGALEPVYVESKVTVYPGPVDVDYVNNLVVRRGDATVNLEVQR